MIVVTAATKTELASVKDILAAISNPYKTHVTGPRPRMMTLTGQGTVVARQQSTVVQLETILTAPQQVCASNDPLNWFLFSFHFFNVPLS